MSEVVSTEPLSLDYLLKTYLETKNTLNVNESAELEIKFATRKIKKITKYNFDNVIQQLLAHNFKFEEDSKYYLSINTDDIRVEIHNLKNIQNYCNTNTLPDEPGEEYNFTEKTHYRLGEENQPAQINFDDFNFRIAYSIETALLSTSDDVQLLLKSWTTTTKFYRLINRYTMVHDDYPVKIDLSIVRESKDEKQNFKEANILKLNGKYEVEIEVLNDKIPVDQPSQQLDKLLKHITKYILSGLQSTNYPVSYKELHNISIQYLQLIHGKEHTHENAAPKDFIGPSSTTLQVANIAPINKNSTIVKNKNKIILSQIRQMEIVKCYILQV